MTERGCNSLYPSDLKETVRLLPMVYLALALSSCDCNYVNPDPPIPVKPTAQQIIEKYDAYWGSTDELGQTGWCSESPIPPEEYEIMRDCSNATPERTVQGTANGCD